MAQRDLGTVRGRGIFANFLGRSKNQRVSECSNTDFNSMFDISVPAQSSLCVNTCSGTALFSYGSCLLTRANKSSDGDGCMRCAEKFKDWIRLTFGLPSKLFHSYSPFD